MLRHQSGVERFEIERLSDPVAPALLARADEVIE